MKTAISVPDPTFARVDEAAARLGVSRSEFYAQAAERWLAELERDGVTARIDATLAAAGDAGESDTVVTSNTRLATMPGNVLLPADVSGLDRDSVVNVTQLMTVDRLDLEERLGELPAWALAELDTGLAGALGLPVRR